MPSVTAVMSDWLVCCTRAVMLSVRRRAVSPKKPACSTRDAALSSAAPAVIFFSSRGRIHRATVPDSAAAAMPAPIKDTTVAAMPPSVCKKPCLAPMPRPSRSTPTIIKSTQIIFSSPLPYGKNRLADVRPTSTAEPSDRISTRRAELTSSSAAHSRSF